MSEKKTMTTAEQMRARILASANPKPVPVDTPAWGRLWLRVLTCADVDGAKPPEGEKMRLAHGVAQVLCDEDGVLLFDPASEEDVKSIATLPWADLSGILAKAQGTAVPEGGEPGNGSPGA
ncbi:hypothetical protein Daci_1641 [Delftia acidovorans SPH-1]|uniref:Uncharacterized protein n=1 Tax=Delftia acidovorans (strain DSM 14801 / SPH-1) TaxID=398578 RepID=A9BYE5_DELAS|nr:hypothetical protein [Delftia acidovorans]ABX34284.1 hypothetical protein Daci_1641 [Delftia acidovorans SPH-1]QPS76336.1 hypothetical protein I6G48_07235 [Delftia acidovorans]